LQADECYVGAISIAAFHAMLASVFDAMRVAMLASSWGG